MAKWMIVFIAPMLILSGCDKPPIVFTVVSKDYSKHLDIKKYQVCQNNLKNCSTDFQIFTSPNNDHYIISNTKHGRGVTLLINDTNIISYKTREKDPRRDTIEKISFLLIGFLIALFTTALNFFFAEKAKLFKTRRKILKVIMEKSVSDSEYWVGQLERFAEQIINVNTMASKISTKYTEISDQNYNFAKKKKIFKSIIIEQVCN